TSNKMLFHCFARYRPGAWPLSISCASQALYTWLARSPASIRRCQKHGSRTTTLTARMAHRLRRRNASVKLSSFKKRAHVSLMTCRGPMVSLALEPVSKMGTAGRVEFPQGLQPDFSSPLMSELKLRPPKLHL